MKKLTALAAAAAICLSAVTAAPAGAVRTDLTGGITSGVMVKESGKCGENAKWTLEGGTLTITGTGEMTDPMLIRYVPWNEIKKQITEVVIENGITSIGTYAFSGCSNLRSVRIPNSVKEIHLEAFKLCSSLENIEIPESVEVIGLDSFKNCSSLKSITISNPQCEIVGSSETICNSITNNRGVYSGTIVGYTGSSAEKYANECEFQFQQLSGTPTTAPATTTTSTFTTSTMSSTTTTAVTTASSSPVQSGTCGENAKWTLEGGTLTITGTGEMIDPLLIKYVPWDKYRDQITSVEIKNGITNIGTYVFSDCYNLRSVIIPNGVKSINMEAFRNCTSLETVDVPASVETIGRDSFMECSSLRSITIRNPQCKFVGGSETICNSSVNNRGVYSGVIVGYAGSSAEKYANNGGFQFQQLSGTPSTSTTTTTTTTTTSTSTTTTTTSTTTTSTATTSATTSTTQTDSKIIYGDANDDKTVDLADVVHIMQVLANPSRYSFSTQGIINADCYNTGDGITNMDALVIQRFLLGLVKELPEKG